jgi:membrane fusion protein (multidrug efflux system)
VQRVPVRVEIDAKQSRSNRCGVGLSMEASVDLHETSGAPVLSSQAPARASSQTAVFDTPSAEADRRVHEIIASNLGRSATARGALVGAPAIGAAASITH